MTEKIKYDLDVNGQAKVAGAFNQVANAQGKSNKATQQSADVTKVAGSRFSELAGATGNLGTAVALANPKMAQFAGVIGTAGSSVTALMSSIGGVPGIVGATLIGALGVLAVSTAQAAQKQEELRKAVDEATQAMDRQAKAAAALFSAQDPAFAAQLSAAGGLGGLSPEQAQQQIRRLTADIEARERRLEAARKKFVPEATAAARLPSSIEGAQGFSGALFAEATASESKRKALIEAQVDAEGQRLEQLKQQRSALQQLLETQQEITRESEKSAGITGSVGTARKGATGPSRDLEAQNQDRIRALTELEKKAVNERIENELEAERDASRVREQIAEHDLRVRQENQDKIIRDATQANEELIELDKEATRRRIQNQELYRAAATSAFSAVGSIAGQTAAAVIQGEQVVIKELLASIGSQMAAHGASLTFQGLGRVISSYGADGSGYALIKTGVAEAAIGIGLGGISVGLAGGSGGSGAGASQSTSLTNPRAFASASGGGGAGGGGPTIINFQSPLRPSARDAETIKRIMEQDSRKNGSR